VGVKNAPARKGQIQYTMEAVKGMDVEALPHHEFQSEQKEPTHIKHILDALKK